MVSADAPAKKLAPVRFVSILKRPRWRRILVYGVIALVLHTGVGVVVAGWYLSSQVLALAPDHPGYSLGVMAVRANSVALSRTSDTLRPGTFGLQWTPRGHATLGAVISSNQASVVRQITGNTRGLKPGAHVHFDIFVYSFPSALHLRYQRVSVPGRLGLMPAWYIPGRNSTWVVLVHGHGESRREGMRPLRTLANLGLPVLYVSYRNDADAPASSDHQYHLGATEWQDVQAAVQYALARGARRVVLYGYSMGGSLVESFLHRSPQARAVRAVVLDAPALDWGATYDFEANQTGVPGPVTALTKWLVAQRLGLGSLDDVNRVNPGADFRVRTLLFQGTSDTSVPWKVNAALAHARPRLVTYVQVAGAEHTQAWNANPAAYDARLKAFLTPILR